MTSSSNLSAASDPNDIQKIIQEILNEIQEDQSQIAKDQSQIDQDREKINAKTRVPVHTQGGHTLHTEGGATVYTLVDKYTPTQIKAFKDDIAKCQADQVMLELQIQDLEISAVGIFSCLASGNSRRDRSDLSDFNLLLNGLRHLINCMKDENQLLGIDNFSFRANDSFKESLANKEENTVEPRQELAINDDRSSSVAHEAPASVPGIPESNLPFKTVGAAILPLAFENGHRIWEKDSQLDRKSSRSTISFFADFLKTIQAQIKALIAAQVENFPSILAKIDRDGRHSFQVLASALQLKASMDSVSDRSLGLFAVAKTGSQDIHPQVLDIAPADPAMEAAWDIAMASIKAATASRIAPAIEQIIEKTASAVANALEGDSLAQQSRQAPASLTPITSEPPQGVFQAVEQTIRFVVNQAVETAVLKTVFLSLLQNSDRSVKDGSKNLSQETMTAIASGAAQSAAAVAARQMEPAMAFIGKVEHFTPEETERFTAIGQMAANQAVAIATNTPDQDVARVSTAPDWRQLFNSASFENPVSETPNLQVNPIAAPSSQPILPVSEKNDSAISPSASGNVQQIFMMLDEIVESGTLFPIVMEGALRTFVKSASCLQSLSEIAGAGSAATIAKSDAVHEIGDAQSTGVLNFLESEIVKKQGSMPQTETRSAERDEGMQEYKDGAHSLLSSGLGRVLAV